MNAHYFFFAINTETHEVECYATKYLPVTNYNSSRFKFWRVNAAFEKIGEAKTVSWSHDHTGQEEQLQAALGEKWQVLDFWQTCRAIQNNFSPAK